MTTHNNVGFARKKAQTISFIERGFERLGLGHKTVDSSWCSYIAKSVCSRSFSPGGGLGGSDFWPFFPAPFPGWLTFPFILACIPYSTSTCGFDFLGLILVPSAYNQSG